MTRNGLKRLWKCLQHCCKLQKVFRGTCSVSASSDFSFWAFAGVLQAPISPFGHLQKFCKLHFPLWGLCRSPAREEKRFLAFAILLQAFPEALWPLQRSIKDMLQR